MERPTNSRRTKRRILLALLSLCVSLGLAELAVRALDLAPELYPVQAGRFRLSANPRIGYELVPHFDADGTGQMLDFRGKANALGFRDREHPLPKPDGTYRVIVLGDSIVQGLFVEHDEQVLTAVMEQGLHDAGQSVEVLNFGVSGYAPSQEVATLEEKGLAYHPDLVLLCVCINDTYLDCFGILDSLERAAEGRRPVATPPSFLRGSALVRLAYGVARGYAEASTEPLEKDLGRDTVTEALGELADLSGTAGFDVGIVWFPRLVPPPDPRDAELYERVRASALQNGFDFYDLTADLQAAAAEGPIAFDKSHPNVAGHRAAGLALARHVRWRWLGPR